MTENYFKDDFINKIKTIVSKLPFSHLTNDIEIPLDLFFPVNERNQILINYITTKNFYKKEFDYNPLKNKFIYPDVLTLESKNDVLNIVINFRKKNEVLTRFLLGYIPKNINENYMYLYSDILPFKETKTEFFFIDKNYYKGWFDFEILKELDETEEYDDFNFKKNLIFLSPLIYKYRKCLEVYIIEDYLKEIFDNITSIDESFFKRVKYITIDIEEKHFNFAKVLCFLIQSLYKTNILKKHIDCVKEIFYIIENKKTDNVKLSSLFFDYFKNFLIKNKRVNFDNETNKKNTYYNNEFYDIDNINNIDNIDDFDSEDEDFYNDNNSDLDNDSNQDDDDDDEDDDYSSDNTSIDKYFVNYDESKNQKNTNEKINNKNIFSENEEKIQIVVIKNDLEDIFKRVFDYLTVFEIKKLCYFFNNNIKEEIPYSYYCLKRNTFYKDDIYIPTINNYKHNVYVFINTNIKLIRILTNIIKTTIYKYITVEKNNDDAEMCQKMFKRSVKFFDFYNIMMIYFYNLMKKKVSLDKLNNTFKKTLFFDIEDFFKNLDSLKTESENLEFSVFNKIYNLLKSINLINFEEIFFLKNHGGNKYMVKNVNDIDFLLNAIYILEAYNYLKIDYKIPTKEYVSSHLFIEKEIKDYYLFFDGISEKEYKEKNNNLDYNIALNLFCNIYIIQETKSNIIFINKDDYTYDEITRYCIVPDYINEDISTYDFVKNLIDSNKFENKDLIEFLEKVKTKIPVEVKELYNIQTLVDQEEDKQELNNAFKHYKGLNKQQEVFFIDVFLSLLIYLSNIGFKINKEYKNTCIVLKFKPKFDKQYILDFLTKNKNINKETLKKIINDNQELFDFLSNQSIVIKYKNDIGGYDEYSVISLDTYNDVNNTNDLLLKYGKNKNLENNLFEKNLLENNFDFDIFENEFKEFEDKLKILIDFDKLDYESLNKIIPNNIIKQTELTKELLKHKGGGNENYIEKYLTMIMTKTIGENKFDIDIEDKLKQLFTQRFYNSLDYMIPIYNTTDNVYNNMIMKNIINNIDILKNNYLIEFEDDYKKNIVDLFIKKKKVDMELYNVLVILQYLKGFIKIFYDNINITKKHFIIKDDILNKFKQFVFKKFENKTERENMLNNLYIDKIKTNLGLKTEEAKVIFDKTYNRNDLYYQIFHSIKDLNKNETDSKIGVFNR